VWEHKFLLKSSRSASFNWPAGIPSTTFIGYSIVRINEKMCKWANLGIRSQNKIFEKDLGSCIASSANCHAGCSGKMMK